MEGLILAAGLGTRLQPLTNNRPKALVEIGGRTLLEICIQKLAAIGITHCVVNVHHFAPLMIEYLAKHQWPCRISVSDESGLLLDTGGALRHAGPLFNGHETVLVHNVDVLSGIDLQAVVEQHEHECNMVTMCVSDRPNNRALVFSNEGFLVDRKQERYDWPSNYKTLAFSGITAINPVLFSLLPEDDHPYPIIDEYIRLSREGYRITYYEHPKELWLDVGTKERLNDAKNSNWLLNH